MRAFVLEKEKGKRGGVDIGLSMLEHMWNPGEQDPLGCND